MVKIYYSKNLLLYISEIEKDAILYKLNVLMLKCLYLHKLHIYA